MSSNEIRAAVVGLGWAAQEHLKAYLALPNVTVVGIADLNEELLRSAQTTYKLSSGYTDYREMIETEKPDVVSVGTPNFAHAEPSIFALDNGCHVLVEKPLARSYDEGIQMVRAAERNDRVLQVMFNQRYGAGPRALQAYVDERSAGEIYHAKARWLRRDGIPGRGRKWFVTKELSGGGPLIDLGVHMLDMGLHLMGEPKALSVSGATYNRLGQRFVTELYGEDAAYEVEDFATALIRLEAGKTLQLEASWATYREDGDLINVTLFGERGGAEMAMKKYKHDDSVRFYTDAGGGPAEVVPAIRHPTISGHQQAAQLFLEHVRSGDFAKHRGYEGLLRTWIIDAIYRSAAENREILLDEFEK